MVSTLLWNWKQGFFLLVIWSLGGSACLMRFPQTFFGPKWLTSKRNFQCKFCDLIMTPKDNRFLIWNEKVKVLKHVGFDMPIKPTLESLWNRQKCPWLIILDTATGVFSKSLRIRKLATTFLNWIKKDYIMSWFSYHFPRDKTYSITQLRHPLTTEFDVASFAIQIPP